MNYYAGLDVSLEETAICVVDGAGLIVNEVRAASEPEALIAALKAIDVPLERIGLEACSLTAWLHDGLRGAGLPAICIETRQANAAMKTMPNKTDRNDARALAQIMRTGWYRPVHVKSRPCPLWRSLLVARRTVLNETGCQRSVPPNVSVLRLEPVTEGSAGDAPRSLSPKSFRKSPLTRSGGIFLNSVIVTHLFSTSAKTTAEADKRLLSSCTLEGLRLSSGSSKLLFLSTMTYQIFPAFAAAVSALTRCFASFKAFW